MAEEWEGFLKDKPVKIENGLIVFTVEYRKDGEETIAHNYRFDNFSDEILTNVVRERLSLLNNQPDLDAVQTGKVDVSAPEQPPVDEEALAFRRDFAKLNIYRLLEFAGVDLTENAGFIELKERVQANFNPEYLGL